MAKKFLYFGVGEGPIPSREGKKYIYKHSSGKICLKSSAYTKTHSIIGKIWREAKYLAVCVFYGELYRFV